MFESQRYWYVISLAENNETSNQTLSQITDLSRPSAEDEFLKLYPRTTISGLVDCKTVSHLPFHKWFLNFIYNDFEI